MKYGLGTVDDSYNQTDYIRLNAELFFRNAIAQVREGEAFKSGEHILDIGCGRGGFFRKAWDNVSDVRVTGVEINAEDSGRYPGENGDRKIVTGDFFNVELPEAPFDVVHASYSMTWMMSPREGVGNIGANFWSRVGSLIKDNGWFLAHHPGDEDYFPDYNKLIIDSLSKIGHDLGDPSKYWETRREFVSSPKMADLRQQCAEANFRIHLLANSLEWIPIKADDYFAYWESGGKGWLMKAMNEDFTSYEKFREKFLESVENDELLSELGISMFEMAGVKYIIAPSWHQYIIAQKCGSAADGDQGPPISWKSINAPLQAHALARMMGVESSILESAYELSQNIYSSNEHIAYLALIEAMGKPRIKAKKFHADYINRMKWINDGGSRFNLSTFTSVLADLIACSSMTERPPIGVIGTIIDKSSEAVDVLMHGEVLSSTENDALHYVFCWPEDTLNSKVAVDCNAHFVNLGCDLIIDSINNGSSNWPRLFFQSDAASKVLRMMASRKGKFSTYLEPLRYFDWQTRVTAPHPQSFLLATTLVRGVNGDPESLPSLFGMVARTAPNGVTASKILSDSIALQLLLALGTGEMSKTMVNALANLKREEQDLRRSHEMLMKLQRPLDALTDAFNTVQAEAQEMQAILNDPEEGLFKAHKILAPLYHEGHPIQISHYLSLVPDHDWTESLSLEELQAAYCYALTCIFGVQNRMFDSQTHAAFVEKAYTALKEKRESIANDKLIRLLAVLCGIGKLELESSVRKGSTLNMGSTVKESEQEARKRFSNALQMLKRVAFTPFKSFGRVWPTAPVQVAAVTEMIMEGTEEVDPNWCNLAQQDTPFSQQAILTFILGMKSEIKAKLQNETQDEEPISKMAVCKSTVNADLSEYRFEIPRRFFGSDTETNDPHGHKLSADLKNLQDCIGSTIRHGIVGKVMGSFHGIF